MCRIPLLAVALFVSAAMRTVPQTVSGAGECLILRLMGVRESLFVLATAANDTVRTGPGPVAYSPGQNARGGLETIHGQRFRLDRSGGDVPAELAGFAAGAEIILVPHHMECEGARRWTEGARWAPAGEQRFAAAWIRPRAEWMEGKPTFDVAPSYASYPYGRLESKAGREPLSAAQVFELEAALPTAEESSQTPCTAYERFYRWMEAHPDLAVRDPATWVLTHAESAAHRCPGR